MIVAKLTNRSEYCGIHPALDRALELLTEEFLENVSTEKTLLDGDDLFVTKFHLQTVPREETIFEAHKQYLDIQIVTEGKERVEIAHPAGLEPIRQKDDFYAYTGEAEQSVLLTPGTFVVLFPGDAHRLKLPVNEPGEAFTRVVFKIKVYD